MKKTLISLLFAGLVAGNLSCQKSTQNPEEKIKRNYFGVPHFVDEKVIKPTFRIGSIPYHILTRFSNPNNLGTHRKKEANGQLYSKYFGPIDLAHFRNLVDTTRYIKQKTKKHLLKGNENFSFKLSPPSRYYVEIDYPDNWDSLSEYKKQKISENFSIQLGGYLSHKSAIWHEMITWFGFKSSGFIPEFDSAFSCEDNFSDLFGIKTAQRGLRLHSDKFNPFLDVLLKSELKRAKVLPKESAKKAAKYMKKKRNFDIGLDGFVTPWIVEEVSGNVKPISYAVPNLSNKYGFSVKLNIQPNVWEGKDFYRILGEKRRISPEKDFPMIMEAIRKQADKKGIEYQD